MSVPAGGTAARFANIGIAVPLDDLIAEHVIPQLGEKTIAKLRNKDTFNVQTWGDLFGQFFLCSLDAAAFQKYLTSEFDRDENVLSQQATPISEAMAVRFKKYNFIDSKKESDLPNKKTGADTKMRFDANVIPRGSLREGFVPGLGEVSVSSLIAAGITRFEQLWALWFLNGRNASVLTDTLKAKGVTHTYKEIAEEVHLKLSKQGW